MILREAPDHFLGVIGHVTSAPWAIIESPQRKGRWDKVKKAIGRSSWEAGKRAAFRKITWRGVTVFLLVEKPKPLRRKALSILSILHVTLLLLFRHSARSRTCTSSIGSLYTLFQRKRKPTTSHNENTLKKTIIADNGTYPFVRLGSCSICIHAACN